MRIFALLFLFLAAPFCAADSFSIAVATNIQPLVQKITDPFLSDSGNVVTYSPGASDALATQIQQGAQYDLFFAADAQSPQAVAASKSLPAYDTFCYASGSLVLAGGEGGLAALAKPKFSLAIVDPATAPAGSAAMEVLAQPEFAAGGSRKLVKAASATQALEMWESGEVDMALLPRELSPTGTPVPAAWHKPLAQYAVVLNHSAAIDAYLQWLRSDAARALVKEAGYEPCP